MFGEQVLNDLGFSEDEARETIEDVRRRDEERLTLQVAGGLQAGRALMRNNISTPQPEPYVKPRREGSGAQRGRGRGAGRRGRGARSRSRPDPAERR